MRELSDDECNRMAREVFGYPCQNLATDNSLIRAGYAAGYRAARAGAAQAVTDGPAADPIADLCARLRGYNPPDRTIDAQRQMAQDIAEAADALERLARERDSARHSDAHTLAVLKSAERDYLTRIAELQARAERAEAERDTLLAIVRAADELREWLHPDRDSPDKLIWVCQDYDAARAAWKGEV